MSETLLEIRDLWKCFPVAEGAGGEIEVLRGVNLRIGAGETVAIVGPSGVGKSTLLHILGTLDRPTRGSVLFRGRDIFGRSSDALARFRAECLGFVFQFHHLLPEFSALENVMMPGLLRGLASETMRARAEVMLQDVKLSHRVDHRVGKLSGGERQRVALARALVMDPPILLADEPTGNLDTHTAEHIDALLLQMNRERGTALVVVTHNERLARRLGRQVHLEEGRVVGTNPGAT